MFKAAASNCRQSHSHCPWTFRRRWLMSHIYCFLSKRYTFHNYYTVLFTCNKQKWCLAIGRGRQTDLVQDPTGSLRGNISEEQYINTLSGWWIRQASVYVFWTVFLLWQLLQNWPEVSNCYKIHHMEHHMETGKKKTTNNRNKQMMFFCSHS